MGKSQTGMALVAVWSCAWWGCADADDDPNLAEHIVGTWEYLAEGDEPGAGSRISFAGDGTWLTSIPGEDGYETVMEGNWTTGGDLLDLEYLHYLVPGEDSPVEIPDGAISRVRGTIGIDAAEGRMIGFSNTYGAPSMVITYAGGDAKTLVGEWRYQLHYEEKGVSGASASDVTYTLKKGGDWLVEAESTIQGQSLPKQAGAGRWSAAGSTFTVSQAQGSYLHGDGTYDWMTAGRAFTLRQQGLGPIRFHLKIE